MFVPGTVAHALAMWFTADIREACALGLDRGGRVTAAKTSATSVRSASTPHFVFPIFMYENSCVLLGRLTVNRPTRLPVGLSSCGYRDDDWADFRITASFILWLFHNARIQSPLTWACFDKTDSEKRIIC